LPTTPVAVPVKNKGLLPRVPPLPLPSHTPSKTPPRCNGWTLRM
jgi:hypothetical protein